MQNAKSQMQKAKWDPRSPPSGAGMRLLEGRQIFLTGFMATGKSKIGPLLAGLLGRPFVDTDALVEETAGKTIAEIFETEGEAVFRRIEHDCVATASAMPDSVISLGGGAITQEANWDVMRQTGVCLCLKASVETIFARVTRSDERPLLSGLGDAERMDRIHRMLNERKRYYSRADVFVTSTEDRTPGETADLAVKELGKLDPG